MKHEEEIKVLRDIEENSLSNVSIDCVVFGFDKDQGQLNVLLLKRKYVKDWALPGGFIGKTENLQDAAHRVLEERTGANIFHLKQFQTFGEIRRSEDTNEIEDAPVKFPWLNNRFITIAFYALVDYKDVQPKTDIFSSDCCWQDIQELPSLMFDHKEILENALHSLRRSLRYCPVGYGLLPEKFTLPELQTLYEIILAKKLNRGNFYRKIMKYELLDKLDEVRNVGGHKPPFLYSFNKKKYEEAVANGLKDIW